MDARRAFLVGGLAFLLLPALLPPPLDMAPAAWRTVAVAGLMVTWWVGEAIPVAATALVPLVLLPAMGVLDINSAAAPYANPTVMLFLGGFLIAQAMQSAGLHRRLALEIIARVGTRPDALIGGFMTAAAALSMWISNTATAVMMLPVAISVVDLSDRHDGGTGGVARARLAVPLMLGIAYGCSIGGLGTLIGSPPNALLAAFLSERYGVTIGFAGWMAVGLPVVLVGVPLAWVVLTRIAYRVDRIPVPGAAETVARQLQALGAASRAEWIVGAVFAATAAAWLLRPVLASVMPGLSDASVAIAGAVALFALPIDSAGRRALDWASAKAIPWDVLLLVGGGLSLASALATTGVGDWVGLRLQPLRAVPLPVTIVLVVALIVFLTEVMSNTAAAATFLPIVAALAVDLGYSPATLAWPAALAASCAFMMPVATPPNAVVFSTGMVSMRQMIRAGFLLNLLFIALIALLAPLLIR